MQPDSNQTRPNRNEGRRIKIKNGKWALSKEEITNWLEKYGTITVPISEETYQDGSSDNDDDEEELGTGSYWVTMKLTEPIPQFIPMHGKKVEIYYRGMQQLCVKCYSPGHKKMDCPNEKVEWMDYVCNFIMATEIDKDMFGKWYYIARKHMRNKPGQQERIRPQQETEKQTETEQTGTTHGVIQGPRHREVAVATGEENKRDKPNESQTEWTVVGASAKTNATSKTSRTARMVAPPETTQTYRKSSTYMMNTASKTPNQEAVAARTRRRNSLNN